MAFLTSDLYAGVVFTPVKFLHCCISHFFAHTAPFSLQTVFYIPGSLIILTPLTLSTVVHICLYSSFKLHLCVFPLYPFLSPSSSVHSYTTFSLLPTALLPPLTPHHQQHQAPTPRSPLFPFLHSRHSELFSMSSFIAGARSQLQLITEHRAGGTRSAFRSALGLLFAINPFHTKLHNLLLPNLNPHSHIRTPQLILYSLAMLMLSPLYLCFSL